MSADGYLILACVLPVLWVIGRGLVGMFVYDEYGFRFSRHYQERVEGDRRALDELVKQLTPCVLAIRRQPQPLVGGAAYSFRPGDDGWPLQLDRVEFFSAQTKAPAPADSFPPECAPLLQKLDGAGVRRAACVRAVRATKPLLANEPQVRRAERGYHLHRWGVLPASWHGHGHPCR